MISQSKESLYATDDKSNMPLYDLLATGIVPESVIRIGIRQMLRQKLQELDLQYSASSARKTRSFAEELKTMPVALHVQDANRQHYEVPAAFFENVLGPHMKYSCCLWSNACDVAESSSLALAESRMLDLTIERARLVSGEDVLDLGCGWGSFSLYAAAKFPRSRFTALSNSRSQADFIRQRARDAGLKNVQVITADISDFDMDKQFDRIVSIEMFEHAKNYQALLAKVAGWLREDGTLFVHIFSHTKFAYHFGEAEDDWLAKYFFTGGTMPSDDLLSYFQDDLKIVNHWRVNGIHYQKTAEAWLRNMQDNKASIMKIIEETYGIQQSRRWWIYWRLFFLACAELWGFQSGAQWIVSHYLFEKRP
jgi:cyclopropane-fatty-acyl-phospholipid synthase